MGQQNRSPEVIDAEFEIVRPADQTVRLHGPQTYVQLPMANAILLAVCVAFFIILFFWGMMTFANERDRACIVLKNTRLSYQPTQVPAFCSRQSLG